MDIREFERIKNCIKEKETENAKNQGFIESIEKRWQAAGINNVNEAQQKVRDLEKDYERLEKRESLLFDELKNSYDWDSVQ